MVNKFLHIIDSISGTQKAMAVVLVGLVGVTVYDVVMRYAVHQPILWGKDMETFMYGGLMLLCAAYTLKLEGHVRIPLLLDQFLPPRGREITMFILYIVFFLPFIAIMIWYGWDFFMKSWVLMEKAFTPWHPPIYPLKFTIPLAAFMLFLQGIAEMTRHFTKIFKGQPS